MQYCKPESQTQSERKHSRNSPLFHRAPPSATDRPRTSFHIPSRRRCSALRCVFVGTDRFEAIGEKVYSRRHRTTSCHPPSGTTLDSRTQTDDCSCSISSPPSGLPCMINYHMLVCPRATSTTTPFEHTTQQVNWLERLQRANGERPVCCVLLR